MISRLICVVFVLLGMLPLAQAKERLHVAVAANFAEPLKQISAEFSTEHNVDIVQTVASSGTLYAQIIHGAPFDLFFSADATRPDKLVEGGRVSASQVMTYAIGQLAYIDRNTQSPDLNSLKTFTLAPGTKLAMADPALAPYGLAAKETLATLAMWQQVLPGVVYGKNVLQAYQYYDTGNVDRALVAYSLVRQREPVFLIPLRYHQPIEQKMAITANAERQALARKFAHFMLSEPVQQQLIEFGYLPVSASVKETTTNG